jgi:2,4-diaminopentanoate dehydrogenase
MVTTILDHRADLDIVGARVYSPAKAGTDIGALVGRDPIGVKATADVDRILTLEADCVLYTPRNASIDEVCAILSSGKNVATTAFLFHPRQPALPPPCRCSTRFPRSAPHRPGLPPRRRCH